MGSAYDRVQWRKNTPGGGLEKRSTFVCLNWKKRKNEKSPAGKDARVTRQLYKKYKNIAKKQSFIAPGLTYH